MTAALKFTGDFKALDKWIKQLAAVPDSMRVISTNLAEETIELIREGFETSTDPYGKPWEPLKLRAGQPLRDKGGLQSSWHKRFTTAQGFVVTSGKAYAKYHQGGTGIHGPKNRPIKSLKAKALRIPGPLEPMFRKAVDGVPRRRMVPERGEIPGRWQKRYVEVAQEVLAELFK